MDLSSRIFVTSDTHFGDVSVCNRFGRDFGDVQSMNQKLIEEINAVVSQDDILMHLGDFVGDMAESRVRHAESLRDQIACRRIILVRGNHAPVDQTGFTRLFESVHDLLSFKIPSPEEDSKQIRLVLSHYPLRVWQGRHNGSLHLYGHVHGTVEEHGRSTDVGVDSWGLRPQLLDELAGLLCRRPVEFNRIRPRIQPQR